MYLPLVDDFHFIVAKATAKHLKRVWFDFRRPDRLCPASGKSKFKSAYARKQASERYLPLVLRGNPARKPAPKAGLLIRIADGQRVSECLVPSRISTFPTPPLAVGVEVLNLRCSILECNFFWLPNESPSVRISL